MKYETTATIHKQFSKTDDCQCCEGKHCFSTYIQVDHMDDQKTGLPSDIDDWISETILDPDNYENSLGDKKIKITVEVLA